MEAKKPVLKNELFTPPKKRYKESEEGGQQKEDGGQSPDDADSDSDSDSSSSDDDVNMTDDKKKRKVCIFFFGLRIRQTHVLYSSTCALSIPMCETTVLRRATA